MPANSDNHLKKRITVNIALILAFFVISMFAAYFYTRIFPTEYSAKAQLRLETSDKNFENVFLQDIEAQISKQDFANEIKNFIGKEPYNQITQKQTIQAHEKKVISIDVSYNDKKTLFDYIEFFTSKLEKYLAKNNSNIYSQKLDRLKQKISSLDEKIRLVEIEIENKNSSIKENNQTENETNDQEKIDLDLSIVQLKEKISLLEAQLIKTPQTITLSESIKKIIPNKEIENELMSEQNRLAMLYRTYKDKHPKVIACKENIKKLKSLIESKQTTTQSNVPNPNYEKIKQIIKKEKHSLIELESRLNELNNSEAVQRQLENKTEEKNKETLDKLIYQINAYKDLRNEATGELETLKIRQNNFVYRITSILPNYEQCQEKGTRPVFAYLIAIIVTLIFSALSLLPFVLAGFSSKKDTENETVQITTKENNIKPVILTAINEKTEVSANAEKETIIKTTEPPSPKIEETKKLSDLTQVDSSEINATIETIKQITENDEKSATNNEEKPQIEVEIIPIDSIPPQKEEQQIYFGCEPLSNIRINIAENKENLKQLFAINDPDSDISKQYAMVAEKLQIEMSKTDTRVLLPVSCKAQIGKTTWISNIAAILANSGYRVLIIDCNQAHPNMHEIFGLSNKIGLVDVLNGENIAKATQKTNINDLYLLSIGNTNKYPVSKTYIDGLESIIKVSRRRSDIIFIDSPSINQDTSLSSITDSKISIIYLNKTSDTDEDRSTISNTFNKFPFCGYVKL